MYAIRIELLARSCFEWLLRCYKTKRNLQLENVHAYRDWWLGLWQLKFNSSWERSWSTVLFKWTELLTGSSSCELEQVDQFQFHELRWNCPRPTDDCVWRLHIRMNCEKTKRIPSRISPCRVNRSEEMLDLSGHLLNQNCKKNFFVESIVSCSEINYRMFWHEGDWTLSEDIFDCGS